MNSPPTFGATHSRSGLHSSFLTSAPPRATSRAPWHAPPPGVTRRRLSRDQPRSGAPGYVPRRQAPAALTRPPEYRGPPTAAKCARRTKNEKCRPDPVATSPPSPHPPTAPARATTNPNAHRTPHPRVAQPPSAVHPTPCASSYVVPPSGGPLFLARPQRPPWHRLFEAPLHCPANFPLDIPAFGRYLGSTTAAGVGRSGLSPRPPESRRLSRFPAQARRQRPLEAQEETQ